MSANLYETKDPGQYYHIHGSLEASTTLEMIGLPSHIPGLEKHEDIVATIEPAVQRFTIDELEALNRQHRQAGVKAFTFDEFAQTPHGKTNLQLPPWAVTKLESTTPPCPLPPATDRRPLAGIKVLELCRIIAGPTITRILAEYGADVLKVTSPNLSDVPFFQVDVNFGKRTAELDLKTPEGRERLEALMQEVDVVVDGYRPGALDRLGYGAEYLRELALKRGKGVVYVNENCFGYSGEWSDRAGWQQIADCVSVFSPGSYVRREQCVPEADMSDNRSAVSPGHKADSWASTSPLCHPSPSPTTAPAAWAPSPP